MLTFTITGDAVEINDRVRNYIEKRFRGFRRFADEGHTHEIAVTLRKNTAHTRDDMYRAEVMFKLFTTDFFAAGEGLTIHEAIDAAKAELMQEVSHVNDRRRTLFQRGARKLKNFMKRGPRRSEIEEDYAP